MPSNDDDISSSTPDLIGLPTHRVLRSLNAMPLPRSSHDRLDRYDALRLTIARQTRMFGDTPAIAAVTVLSVLRQGFADVHDGRIDLLMREFAAARVSLDRWFCIDQQLKIVDVETLAVLPH